jgi:hypothetical protein
MEQEKNEVMDLLFTELIVRKDEEGSGYINGGLLKSLFELHKQCINDRKYAEQFTSRFMRLDDDDTIIYADFYANGLSNFRINAGFENLTNTATIWRNFEQYFYEKITTIMKGQKQSQETKSQLRVLEKKFNHKRLRPDELRTFKSNPKKEYTICAKGEDKKLLTFDRLATMVNDVNINYTDHHTIDDFEAMTEDERFKQQQQQQQQQQQEKTKKKNRGRRNKKTDITKRNNNKATDDTITTADDTITTTDDIKNTVADDRTTDDTITPADDTITTTDDIKQNNDTDDRATDDIKQNTSDRVTDDIKQITKATLYDCKCGSKSTRKDLHERTKRHKNYISSGVIHSTLTEKQRRDKFYEKHKDEIYKCECGKDVRRVSKQHHIITLHHRNFIEQKESRPKGNHMTDCDICGSTFMKYELSKHVKSKRHLKNLESSKQ